MMSEMSVPLDRPLERGSAGEEVRFQVDDRYACGRGVVLTQKPLLDQNGLRPAAGDDVARLFRLESRVDRDQHATRGEQPERRDDPLRGVGRPKGDPIALVHAEVGEGACGATNPFDNLRERETQRTVDDRFRVAEPVRRAQDHLGDGLPQRWACHTVTSRPRLPPMIFAWSSTDRCDSALT